MLQVGGTVSAAAACACLVAIATLPSVAGHGTAPVAALPHVALSRAETGTRPATAPAGWLDAQELVATDAVQRDIHRSLRVADVPANLHPSLADADADEAAPFVDGCLDSYLSSVVASCTFGDTTSSTSVVLFGDSHAAMWFPAVDGAANALGWKLLTLTKATCPPLDVPVFSPVLGRAFTECTQWRANVLARIAAVKPALVILGVARHYSDAYHFTVYGPQWTGGLAAMVRAIRALGPQVLVLGPVPKPPFDVPGCLSVHLSDAPACTEPLSQGINAAGMAAERAAVRGREAPISTFGRGSAPRTGDGSLQVAADHHQSSLRQHCHRPGIDVFDEGLRHHAKLHAAVDAAKGQVIDVLAKGRDVAALRRIEFHRDHIVSAVLQVLRDFETERCVAALVLVELVPVHGDGGGCHRAGEIEKDAFALPLRRRAKVTPVGGDKLKAALIKTVPRQAHIGVRQGDLLPRRVIEIRGRDAGRGFAAEQPSAVQFIHAALWNRSGRGALCLRLHNAHRRRAEDEHAPIDAWLVAHNSAVR